MRGFPTLSLGLASVYATKLQSKLTHFQGHERNLPHLVAWVGEYFKTYVSYLGLVLNGASFVAIWSFSKTLDGFSMVFSCLGARDCMACKGAVLYLRSACRP